MAKLSSLRSWCSVLDIPIVETDTNNVYEFLTIHHQLTLHLNLATYKPVDLNLKYFIKELLHHRPITVGATSTHSYSYYYTVNNRTIGITFNSNVIVRDPYLLAVQFFKQLLLIQLPIADQVIRLKIFHKLLNPIITPATMHEFNIQTVKLTDASTHNNSA